MLIVHWPICRFRFALNLTDFTYFNKPGFCETCVLLQLSVIVGVYLFLSLSLAKLCHSVVILYATCTLNTTVMRFSYDAPCSVAGRLKLWNVCVCCSHLQRVSDNVMSCWCTVCSPRRRRLLWLVQVSETLVLHTATNTYDSQTTIYNTLGYFKTFDSIQLRRAGFKCVEARGRIIIRGPYPPSNAIIYMH